jgi:hypothetical protein
MFGADPRVLEARLRDIERASGPRGVEERGHWQARYMSHARARLWEVVRKLGADHLAWLLTQRNPAAVARGRARGAWDANNFELESAYERLETLIETGELERALSAVARGEPTPTPLAAAPPAEQPAEQKT